MIDSSYDTPTVLTVQDALAQIPDLLVENIAIELMEELEIHLVDAETKEFKIIKKYLRYMVERALYALEPATIISGEDELVDDGAA
jgi:hypothetical protein